MGLLLIFSTVAAACSGGDGGNNGGTGGTGGAGGGGGDLAGVPGDFGGAHDLAQSAGSYPAGPYGNTVGDTIAPLVWEGYVDDLADAVATSKPYGTYSMDQLRLSGKAYALVHVSDFY
jgi:hypothetical protein